MIVKVDYTDECFMLDYLAGYTDVPLFIHILVAAGYMFVCPFMIVDNYDYGR